MSQLDLEAAAPAVVERPAYPPSHGRFDRLGALIARTNTQTIFAVIRDVEGERIRAGRQFWSFEQYERVFAAAQDAGRAAEFLLIPLVRLRARYLAARKARLSPWQFAESERRFREQCDDRAARAAASDRDSVARSKAKAYRALVEEAELKERARREARENVEKEFGGKPAGRVSKRAPSRTAVAAHIADEQTYIPPDPF